MRLALCVLIALLALSCSAYATTIYTSEAAFLAAVAPGYYLESFSTFSDGDPLGGDPSPTDYHSPTVNGFSWNTYAVDGLWSLQNGVSAAYPFEPLVITFTGGPVTAVGGIFAATDYAGDPIPAASVLLALSDGTTKSVDGTGFVGFTSTAPISSISITPVQYEAEASWAAFSHFYTGSTTGGAAVPEPSSILSMLTGLIGGGSIVLRRRRSK